jgi:tetratricopeptide (TPR) repeat protein
MKYGIAPLLIALIFGCTNETKNNQDITAPSPMRCAPQLSDAEWYAQNTPAPLFEGMDFLLYPVTTQNPEAQKYFNQGLLLSYSFNHAEAARSFYHATRLDSTCAMCYWGYAFVLGPNYNSGMDPDHFERAYDAIQKAVKWSAAATPKEKAMIKAMTARYNKEVVEDRSQLDSAFMVAMKGLHAQFPDDVNIAAIYAESLMDMHPWDLWEKDGTAKPWTPEILRAIENAIALDPKHPGGHHYYIHAVEASNEPERALPSCKVFDDGLVANAGHLVHMPSHIYINTGDYHLGTIANIKAVQIDSQYVTQCHAQGAYPLAYYPHNYHFLAACATLSGNSEWAILAANKMSDQTNHTGMLLEPLATLQHFYSIPYFVNVKFAKWNDILSQGPPDSVLLYPNGIYQYAKGMAHIGLNQLDKAQAALDALNLIEKEDTLKHMTIWGFNSMHQIIQIARNVLEGELAAKKGQYDEAVRLLQEAIVIEDALLYQEPPDWFFSVRHHLGAVLLEAKRPADAITVYEEDLKNYPKNGWALAGLKKAFQDLKETDRLQETEMKFKEAWAHADVNLSSSLIR